VSPATAADPDPFNLPLQDDDIPGVVRYRTYEVLKEEVANPQLRWAYLPYSMHMAGPREAIQVLPCATTYDTASLWYCRRGDHSSQHQRLPQQTSAASLATRDEGFR
jgi:ATP-sulfurylase